MTGLSLLIQNFGPGAAVNAVAQVVLYGRAYTVREFTQGYSIAPNVQAKIVASLDEEVLPKLFKHPPRVGAVRITCQDGLGDRLVTEWPLKGVGTGTIRLGNRGVWEPTRKEWGDFRRGAD